MPRAKKKPGPRRGLRRKAEASEHSHQADVARLQLAGDGLRPVHGHEAGLLNRLALTPEVQTEAGD
jgi:cupin superfamily acireductone dioxygenase involved in methionine salvage